MDLAAYFDFVSPNDIRIIGSRIGIQAVLYEIYPPLAHAGADRRALQDIAPGSGLRDYPLLLVHKEPLDAYMAAWLERDEQAWAAQEQNPCSREFQERVRQERLKREAHMAQGVAAATHA